MPSQIHRISQTSELIKSHSPKIDDGTPQQKTELIGIKMWLPGNRLIFGRAISSHWINGNQYYLHEEGCRQNGYDSEVS